MLCTTFQLFFKLEILLELKAKEDGGQKEKDDH